MSEVILCIPGNWKDKLEILSGILKLNNGFISAGGVLHNTNTNQVFAMLIEERYPDLVKAFESGSQKSLDQDLLQNIDNHTFVIYLIGLIESEGDLVGMVKAADTLLSIGGLAVKIDTTGVVHTKETWVGLVNSLEKDEPLYRHFVILVDEEDYLFSYGMKTFNHPDVGIKKPIKDADVIELLHMFNVYNLTSKAKVENNHTFSLSEDSQFYVINKGTDFRSEEKDTYFNEHGLCILEPMKPKIKFMSRLFNRG